ncbi:DUF2514 family protein [Citrobacter braakii]|uniref:DUF2514 family protein n=1 Tax=Citrobacter braakii TaxID=57706 RepID=UPI003AB6AEB5
MIAAILKAYWRQLAGAAIAVALVVSMIVAWNVHGDNRYDAGYQQAKKDQADADAKAKNERDQEKTQIEHDAQARIDLARVDAESANTAADGLRSELDKTKRIAEHYTGSFPSGTPASKVIGVLADMLKESNRSYIATAEEAERYRDAGLTCERQYDSLKSSTLSR